MLNRSSKYFIRIVVAILLVAYVIILMNKINFGTKLVKQETLIEVAGVLVLVGLFMAKNFFQTKFVEIKRIGEKFQETLQVSSLPPKNLMIIVQLGIVFFILLDIFSSNPIKDVTALLLTVVWVFLAQLTGFDGRITILGGLIFLIFCPFFVIFKKEPNAEKAAIWAFMFFVGGVVQELFSKEEKTSRTIIDNLFDSLLKSKRAEAEIPEKAVVVSSLGGISIFDSKAISSPDVTTITFKTKQTAEFLGKMLLINKLAMKIFNNLGEKDKVFFGARYIKLIKSVETDTYEIYRVADNKDKLFAQYYKIRSLLYELIFLTAMMDKYKMASSELLDRLVKLLNEEILKLDSSV